MSEGNQTVFRIPRRWPRLLPFLALGGVVFALNSAIEGNYLLKGYLTLLELQAAIVVIYFLTTKIGKSKNRLLK